MDASWFMMLHHLAAVLEIVKDSFSLGYSGMIFWALMAMLCYLYFVVKVRVTWGSPVDEENDDGDQAAPQQPLPSRSQTQRRSSNRLGFPCRRRHPES